MSQLAELLKHVVEEQGTLTQQQGCSALREMLEGDATDVEIASLLTAIATRGATAEELSGFVQAMRIMSRPVPLSERNGSNWSTPAGPAAMAREPSISPPPPPWWQPPLGSG